jgi:hypothetical protein
VPLWNNTKSVESLVILQFDLDKKGHVLRYPSEISSIVILPARTRDTSD